MVMANTVPLQPLLCLYSGGFGDAIKCIPQVTAEGFSIPGLPDERSFPCICYVSLSLVEQQWSLWWIGIGWVPTKLLSHYSARWWGEDAIKQLPIAIRTMKWFTINIMGKTDLALGRLMYFFAN